MENKHGFIVDLESAIKNLTQVCNITLPHDYTEKIASLIWQTIHRDSYRATFFTGGPLKYDKYGINDAWFYPVEVLYYGQNGDERINFHVIAINCDKGQDLTNAEVLYNFSTDDSLKLEDVDDSHAFELRRTIISSAERKQVIVRVALTGSLAFPITTVAGLDKVSFAGAKLGLEALSQHFGYDANTDEVDDQINALLAKCDADIANSTVVGSQMMTEEKVILSEHGTLYVTEIVDTNTAWKVYRVYSATPLAKINPEKRLFIRIDSGCSIGMNYLDGGCKCLGQLHEALDRIRDCEGIIVHLPTQDGRGYGDVTKIHTEGFKYGLDPKTREPQFPMDTIAAAQLVFGDQIDIRTYSYVGKIIKELGFDSVCIFTDNFFKAYSIGRGAETQDIMIEQPDDIPVDYALNPRGTLDTFVKRVRNRKTYLNHQENDEIASKVKALCEENLEKDAVTLLKLMGVKCKHIAGLSLGDKINRIVAEYNRLLTDTSDTNG